MNERRAAAVAVAAAVALIGAAGAFGAVGLVPVGEPADVPADEPTATPSPTGPDGTTLAHDGEDLTLKNDPGQTVAGTTDLEAGTELEVRLQSSAGTSPFIRQTTATVGEDGSFEATFDLATVAAGTPFSVVVRHDGRELVNGSGEVVEGTVDEVEPTETSPVTVDHDGDALTLASDDDQTVAGSADLEAGTELVVRLRSSGGAQPFIKQTTATVGEDGSFEADFDMSGIDPGVTFTVEVRQDGEVLAELPGEVVAAD